MNDSEYLEKMAKKFDNFKLQINDALDPKISELFDYMHIKNFEVDSFFTADQVILFCRKDRLNKLKETYPSCTELKDEVNHIISQLDEQYNKMIVRSNSFKNHKRISK